MSENKKNDTGIRLKIDPAVIQKLSSGGLWSAAHDDGSKNRVNEDAVIDDDDLSFSLAFLTAGFQLLR